MSDFEHQTVDEYLFGPCSKGVLEERSSDSRYWETVFDFVSENLKTKISQLSPKQKMWLIKIKEGLLE